MNLGTWELADAINACYRIRGMAEAIERIYKAHESQDEFHTASVGEQSDYAIGEMVERIEESARVLSRYSRRRPP